MVKCISKDCSNEGTIILEGEPVCPSCAALAEKLADQVIEASSYGAVRYSLNALKGVGGALGEAISTERQARGPFRSLGDFAHRMDAAVLNKRELTALAKAGAFDCLEPNRAQVVANVDRIIAASKSKKQDDESGNMGLNFGG